MSENKVQIFENENFGKIRTTVIDGAVWFVGKDVTNALGYSNSRKALADHIDDEERDCVTIRDAIGRERRTTVINESGVYALILSSKLSSAKMFKKWITSEVLPTIRKYGAYISDEKLDEVMENSEAAEKLFRELKAEQMKTRKLSEMVDELNATVEELKIKGNFYNDVLQSDNLLPMTVIAKDYGMSAMRMNALLNAYGIQYKMRNGLWVLYSKYQNMGLTKTVTYTGRCGRTIVVNFWTQFGREFLYRFLKEVHGLVPKSERVQPYNGTEDK